MWTHNGRIASLIYVKDCDSGNPIEDSQKIDRIEGRVKNDPEGGDDDESGEGEVEGDELESKLKNLEAHQED